MSDIEAPRKGYDNAAQMRDLRERRKLAGVTSTSVAVPKDQRLWWAAQADLASAAYLETRIAAGDKAVIENCANIHVKYKPHLGLAMNLIDEVRDDLKRLALKFKDATLEQSRYAKEGQEYLDIGDSVNMMLSYAMEYACSCRCRGYKHLIDYYTGGGHPPRIAYDI
ncbi:MAG: hypothetical protein GKR86_01030 [Ilumatobacter sp.]|nr:hypothetical protein [Ilumatobacter sp.]